jgi:hypothetical protein
VLKPWFTGEQVVAMKRPPEEFGHSTHQYEASPPLPPQVPEVPEVLLIVPPR